MGGKPAEPGWGASIRQGSFTFPRAPSPALRQVGFEIRPGSLTALLGPNGSGKSTVLRLLGGLLHPSQGSVLLEGPGGKLDPGKVGRDRVARLVSFLPARPEVPSDYTSLEVVLMARHPFGRGLIYEQPQDLAVAGEALDRMGAGAFRDRPCLELSSGERQRVLLARVICQEAPLLLLDEPTSAQDPAHALELFQSLRELVHTDGRTVVVATHDVNLAARFADVLVVLKAGQLMTRGAPGEVLTAELLREVFEVEALVGDDAGVPYAVAQRKAIK